MPTLLEEVARTRDLRDESDRAFRDALTAAKEFHSWGELAKVAGMSRGGVIHLVTSARREEAEAA